MDRVLFAPQDLVGRVEVADDMRAAVGIPGRVLITRDGTALAGFVSSKRLPLEMLEWLIHCW